MRVYEFFNLVPRLMLHGIGRTIIRPMFHEDFIRLIHRFSKNVKRAHLN
jgi:hypothetical protein